MPDAIAGASKNIDRLLWDIGLQSPISIDSYEVAMQFTRDGLRIGIMPFSTAWKDLHNKSIHELYLKDVPRSTFGCHDLTLFWNPKQYHPGVKVFERIMTDFLSEVITETKRASSPS